MLANWHLESENYSAAHQALQEVLRARTKQFGNEHWRVTNIRRALEDVDLRSKLTADQRRRLGEADDASGRMSRIVPAGPVSRRDFLAAKALKVRREILGENHLRTGVSLNNLAALYNAQSDYARALPLSEQALAIQKKVLGENHPDTATSLINLATLYNAQGDYARALPLSEQAMAIRKKALGENHPDYALSLINLAGLYNIQGDFARALPLYDQALAIQKKVLGENHPDYALSLNNLAGLYRCPGRLRAGSAAVRTGDGDP